MCIYIYIYIYIYICTGALQKIYKFRIYVWQLLLVKLNSFLGDAGKLNPPPSRVARLNLGIQFKDLFKKHHFLHRLLYLFIFFFFLIYRFFLFCFIPFDFLNLFWQFVPVQADLFTPLPFYLLYNMWNNLSIKQNYRLN